MNASNARLPGRRAEHLDSILAFARRSVTDRGFAWLDGHAAQRPSVGRQMSIKARMTHVFSLASLLGRDGAAEVAAHG